MAQRNGAQQPAGTTSPGSAMSGRTGFRLIKLGELAMVTAERALEPLGVRPRHFNVLATLAADDTLSQQDVSRLLGIDPNVLVGVIDELEKQGLAERRRNPQDRRRHVVALTAAGRQVLRDGAALLDEAEAAFFAEVPAAELAVLHEVAARLLARHPAPMKR
ncbi:MarR family winged helix-turn-helix transcriptional regulator [Micromonospora sp. CA-240977]|uniref:MarR family winged helix-turn-helix transcriptional regulator n=1 Tax=Micromonospora sp. CA-240977 TaxID=3239957 RepID=UPI003D915AE9